MKDLIIYQSNGEPELFVQKEVQQVEPINVTAENIVVTIDETETFQEIDGFGASFCIAI